METSSEWSLKQKKSFLVCRTHIECQSLIQGRFPYRGPVSSQIKGRFIFPASRAKIVIYARSGCIVLCDIRVFGAVTSHSKQTFYFKMAATIASKALLKRKDVTAFPDEEMFFFRMKGISIILISLWYIRICFLMLS